MYNVCYIYIFIYIMSVDVYIYFNTPCMFIYIQHVHSCVSNYVWHFDDIKYYLFSRMVHSQLMRHSSDLRTLLGRESQQRAWLGRLEMRIV